MSPDESCVWRAAIFPDAWSMPMNAGTVFCFPFTSTSSVVWMWVARPSASRSGTPAAFVLRTSSADAGAVEPPAGDELPPPLPSVTMSTITAIATTPPVTIQPIGSPGFAAGAGAGARLAGAFFTPAGRGFDFGLGLGLTRAPGRCGAGPSSLTAAVRPHRARLSGSDGRYGPADGQP